MLLQIEIFICTAQEDDDDDGDADLDADAVLNKSRKRRKVGVSIMWVIGSRTVHFYFPPYFHSNFIQNLCVPVIDVPLLSCITMMAHYISTQAQSTTESCVHI